MGLAEGECSLSHPIALWERWTVNDWQLWHLISETVLLGRVTEIDTTGDILAPKLFGEVTNMPAREPLCRECPLALAAIHNAVPCMDPHSEFPKQGGCRDKHTASCFSALREGDCKTELQRLLLCSGSAWEVVCPPTVPTQHVWCW